MNKVCSYGEEQLAALLYEDGEAAEIAQMRAHLATCAECRAELEQLTSMKDLLGAWPNAVNAPRMVYVNERSSLLARLQRWAGEMGQLGTTTFHKPVVAAAAVVLVLVASTALLDVRVAPDGRLQVGLRGSTPATAPINEATAGISREEFQDGLTQAVSYMEDLFRARSDDERRTLVTLIDQRMQEQGMAMSSQLRNAVDGALADMESRHQNDLGLVFSAVDELGVITGSELQRMNAILASLVQRAPDNEE